jgi:hypothetical protein
MSLSPTVPRSVYVGNGSTSSYPWTWLVNADTDLHVAVIDTATPPNITVLSEGTDYTIQTPAIQIGSDAGGYIALTATGFLAPTSGNLPTGWSLVIRRAVSFEQDASLGNEGALQPASIEAALDYLCMQTQQLQDAMLRTLQFSPEDSSIQTLAVLAAARANGWLGFDSNGNPIVTAGTVGQTLLSTFGITLGQTATAAAARAVLGASTVGGNVFTAATAAAARATLGSGLLGDNLFLAQNIQDGLTDLGISFSVPYIPGNLLYTAGPPTAYTWNRPWTGSNSIGTGEPAIFICPANNVGHATVAVNGGIPKTIVHKDGSNLANGDLVSGTMYLLVFDGSYWRIIA